MHGVGASGGVTQKGVWGAKGLCMGWWLQVVVQSGCYRWTPGEGAQGVGMRGVLQLGAQDGCMGWVLQRPMWS